ncbi:MAG: hypothetical protein U0R19_02735 [Bryobacteraceae bacterium]
MRRHLIEKLPVSKVCEEAGIAPRQLYRWQELLFQNAATALESKRRPDHGAEFARIQKLEQTGEWSNRALFRSLNMAENAARLPEERIRHYLTLGGS